MRRQVPQVTSEEPKTSLSLFGEGHELEAEHELAIAATFFASRLAGAADERRHVLAWKKQILRQRTWRHGELLWCCASRTTRPESTIAKMGHFSHRGGKETVYVHVQTE